MPKESKKRGRPEVIPPQVRWKLRECYLSHFGEWGPRVLHLWSLREGLGRYSVGAISRILEDLRPIPEKKAKPKRYEIAAPMLMWSEDGTGFRERGRKQELLVLQDECSRYKVNSRLVDGPANESEVTSYLREAFDKHGAPLILKHDNAAYQNTDAVRSLCEEYGVVLLQSPPHYPPFNGKKERSMRDIKSYEKALRSHRVGGSLQERLDITLRDLNDERPRPVLSGRTAQEAFTERKQRLPDRIVFRIKIQTRTIELERFAKDRKEKQNARRRATMEVLSEYNLLVWKGGVSTHLQPKTGTT